MFGRRNKRQERLPETIEVAMPAEGEVVALDQVPDPVFSGGLVGLGVAVEPTEGTFRAPVSGTITLLAETGHAFAISTEGGLDVLVHIGIDTVTLGGNGFSLRCSVGDRVAVGDPLVEVDLAAIRERVPSLLSPVLVTNPDRFEIVGSTPSGALLVAEKS